MVPGTITSVELADTDAPLLSLAAEHWSTAESGSGDRHGEPHHLQPHAGQGVGADYAQWFAFRRTSSWRTWSGQHRAERHRGAARHPGHFAEWPRRWGWRHCQVCGHGFRGWEQKSEQRWQWLHAYQWGQGQDHDAQAAQTSPRVPGRSGEGGLCYVVYFVTELQATEKDVAARMQVLLEEVQPGLPGEVGWGRRSFSTFSCASLWTLEKLAICQHVQGRGHQGEDHPAAQRMVSSFAVGGQDHQITTGQRSWSFGWKPMAIATLAIALCGGPHWRTGLQSFWSWWGLISACVASWMKHQAYPIQKATGLLPSSRQMKELLQLRCVGVYQHQRLEGGSRTKKAEQWPGSPGFSIIMGASWWAP